VLTITPNPRWTTYYIKNFPESGGGDVSPARGFRDTGGHRRVLDTKLQAVRTVHPSQEVERETNLESVVAWFVQVDEVDELAATSARDFACRIWYDILRLAGVLVGIERLL
jgi:hypothetical protein